MVGNGACHGDVGHDDGHIKIVVIMMVNFFFGHWSSS